MDLLWKAYSTPSGDDDGDGDGEGEGEGPQREVGPTPPPLKRFKPHCPPVVPKPCPLLPGRYISKRERSLSTPAISPLLQNPDAAASPGTWSFHSAHPLFMSTALGSGFQFSIMFLKYGI